MGHDLEARVGGQGHLCLAGYQRKLGDDAGAAGGELDAEEGARAAAAAELLALLHLDIARAAAELEPRDLPLISRSWW